MFFLFLHEKICCLFQIEEINIGNSLKAHAYSHDAYRKVLRSKRYPHSIHFQKSEVRK